MLLGSSMPFPSVCLGLVASCLPKQGDNFPCEIGVACAPINILLQRVVNCEGNGSALMNMSRGSGAMFSSLR